MLSVLIGLSGCAQHFQLPTEQLYNVYAVSDDPEEPASYFAPLLLAHGYRHEYNRIGRPSALLDSNGQEQIYIDADNPAMYFMVHEFATDKGGYTNYIYRFHFPEIPFSLFPFHLSAGDNTGIIVVVTTDSEKRPVLITTVHACGCYLAIVPTTYLVADAYPDNYKSEDISVYGEQLPGLVDYREKENPALLLHFRPGIHRIMDLEIINRKVINDRAKFRSIMTSMPGMDELERIPVNGKTTSFYIKNGMMRGHVKGSVKVLESIFLSTLSLDLFVGTDKAYTINNDYGNPFYTSLKPWNRTASDMQDFPRFLKFWGWRL